LAEAGAMVQMGTPIVRVLAAGRPRIRFAVPDDVKERALSIGTSVDISAPATGDASADALHVRGTVEHVSPEIEPSSRTIFVEAAGDDAATCAGDCAAVAGRIVRVRLDDNAAVARRHEDDSLERSHR